MLLLRPCLCVDGAKLDDFCQLLRLNDSFRAAQVCFRNHSQSINSSLSITQHFNTYKQCRNFSYLWFWNVQIGRTVEKFSTLNLAAERVSSCCSFGRELPAPPSTIEIGTVQRKLLARIFLSPQTVSFDVQLRSLSDRVCQKSHRVDLAIGQAQWKPILFPLNLLLLLWTKGLGA